MDRDSHNEKVIDDHQSRVGNLMDSKTSHLDDILNEKLERAFHKSTAQIVDHDLIKIASEHDPIDLAYAVTRLPISARPVVYENLPDLEAKCAFMIAVGHTTRISIFRTIDDSEIAELLEKMPPDEAVGVLEDLSDRRMRRVFEQLEQKKVEQIQDLQQHERHTAGRLMTNEFFAFHMNVTIGEVASYIRDNPGVELTRSVFVLNDNGELSGYVPSRILIVNPAQTPLRQVMRSIVHTITPEGTRDEIVDIVERYKIAALPVLDDSNHILGVIAYEDVVEIMEDIADETIASMAGTAEHVGEHEPILKRFLWRAPWLVVTLCAGLTTATAMAHFQDRYWWVFVPFFVPLITGMSGNVGIQSSTILVRSMSTGELSAGASLEAAMKEVVLGIVTGSFFGVICGVVVYTLINIGVHHVGAEPLAVGAVVSVGVFGACLLATTLGAFAPLLFAKLRIDPAVASGPIVTAFNDVLSSLMYFFIAYVVSTFLFS